MLVKRVISRSPKKEFEWKSCLDDRVRDEHK
jgi:hypothetical protein